jgi:precorrin-6B methylase 2
VLLIRPPGVYRAQSDTALLTEVLRDRVRGRRVLDVGAGTGALAIAAARAGAASVTAVGLDASVIARAELPFGPVMRARAALLEGRGLIAPGQRPEEIVVVAGARR